MGRKLTANVLVLDEQGNPVLVKAGEEVPSEYADQVGDHCFEQDAESKPAQKRQPAAK